MDFETIYQQIKLSFEETTGQEVHEDSDLGIRMKVIAGELTNVSQQLTVCSQQMFPQTATGSFLDRHAACRGITRKAAGAAAGELTFSRSTAAGQDIIIPAGTVCLSSSNGDVSYETTEQVVLVQGKTRVTAPAQATVVGPAGNVTAKKINTMVSIIAGIESVSNAAGFGGGCEEETDEALRKRLLDSYLVVSNGVNAKYYEDFALRYEGVSSAKAVYAADSNALTLYVTDPFRMISTTLVNQIQEDIQGVRELNVKVTVKKATPVEKNVTAVVYVRNMTGTLQQEMEIVSFLQNKLYELSVGEGINPYMLGKNIESVLPDCVGIVFTTPSAYQSIGAGEAVVPGTVSVSFERRG